MAGLLEMLLAAHMGRGAPMGMPGLPPAIPPELLESGAEPDAAWSARPPALASGAEPSGAWTGGMTPPVQRGLPKDTGNPLMGMLASLMQRPTTPGLSGEPAANPGGGLLRPGALWGMFDKAGEQPAQPSQNAGDYAGLSDAFGSNLPPSTNDPASGEPQVFANGVPLPRPKPIGASGLPAEASEAQAAAPLSMAPPTDVSSAGRAAPGAPAAASGGFGGGLGGMLGKVFNPANAPLLLALGSGLSGAPSFGTGMRRASAAAVAPAALLNRERQTQTNQAETYQALIAKGVPPQEAVAALRNPELLKALIAKHFETKPAQVVNGRLVRENADGSIRTLADYSDDKAGPKLSDGYEWVDAANKSKGQRFIVGGSADPKTKALAARQGEPPKYEWIDPDDHSKGQRPIKGSGAEKVDAQVAARIGLAKSFIGQLPDIRKQIERGEVTGAWDAAQAMAGVGTPGEIRRKIDSGAEALLRNLTGAGMNQQEAANYVRRYQVSPIDTVWSLKSKMSQLERELNFTIEEVNRGRTGDKPATGGGKGTTGSGVNWSIEP